MMGILKRNFIFVQLFLFNCFVSNLHGMNVEFFMKKPHYVQICDNLTMSPKVASMTVDSSPVTLDKIINMFVILRVGGGILLRNYFITPSEETNERKHRKIIIEDIREIGEKELIKLPLFTKIACEKLFNAFKFNERGVRLAGSLLDLYQSVQPDDHTYRLMQFQNMSQIVDGNHSMYSKACFIKSHINHVKGNANEFFKLCGEAFSGNYYNDEEIWFINFFYASLEGSLTLDNYFLTTT